MNPVPGRHYWVGIALGLCSALLWAVYNVGAKKGQLAGFSPLDLTLLRFLGAAALIVPLLIRQHGLPPLRRTLLLALCVGPAFPLALNQGFHYAPLSHAVFIGPFASMVVTNLLLWICHGQRPSADRLVGALLVVAGLFVIARSQGGTPPGTGPVWLGDLCFVLSGSLWGTYVYLMGRWQVPALGVTALVGVLSCMAILPVWLMLPGSGGHPPVAWAEQFVYHGALGGAVAFVAFGLTVHTVGSGVASLFSALVPPVAVLVAIPMLGDLPGPMQWAGVVLATVGMAVALEARQQLRRRP